MWERVVYQRSQYQVIELFYDAETGHLRLDLNGCTQFHSADEYRYHELAIFSAFVTAGKKPKRVLILGGGDGLAVREALKFAERIDLVDIDPDIVKLAKEHKLMRALNEDSMNNEKLKIYCKDAFEWIKSCRDNKYDIVFADYPDPTSPVLEKLFSLEHFTEIKRVLKKDGAFVVQSGGALMLPLMANIGAKLRSLFKKAVPMKVEMLKGIQGFWLAGDDLTPHWERMDGIKTQAFDRGMFASAVNWSKDLRQGLLKGNPNENAYDAYVQSLCWMEYLSVRGGYDG